MASYTETSLFFAFIPNINYPLPPYSLVEMPIHAMPALALFRVVLPDYLQHSAAALWAGFGG